MVAKLLAADPRVRGSGKESRTVSVYAGIAEKMAVPLLALMRSWRPDLVVFEESTYAAALVANALGIPAVRHLWGVDILSYVRSFEPAALSATANSPRTVHSGRRGRGDGGPLPARPAGARRLHPAAHAVRPVQRRDRAARVGGRAADPAADLRHLRHDQLPAGVLRMCHRPARPRGGGPAGRGGGHGGRRRPGRARPGAGQRPDRRTDPAAHPAAQLRPADLAGGPEHRADRGVVWNTAADDPPAAGPAPHRDPGVGGGRGDQAGARRGGHRGDPHRGGHDPR